MKEFLNKNYVLLIIAFVAVVCLSILSYLTVLNYSYDMEKDYVRLSNQEIINEVEFSLENGKKLESYFGLSEVLEKGKKLIDSDCFLFIKSDSGKIAAMSEKTDLININLSDYNEISQPIKNGNKYEGELVTYISKKGVRNTLNPYLKKAAVVCIVLFIIFLIAYYAIVKRFNIARKKTIIIVLVGILLQGAALTFIYADVFADASARTVEGIGKYLQVSLETMQEKGISIDDISGFDEYLQNKSNEYEWIDSIECKEADSVQSDENKIIIKIADNTKDLILVDISDNYVRKQILKMVLTFIATIAIAVVFMVEMMYLPNMIAFRRSKSFNTPCNAQYITIPSILRVSNFLTSTFSYMCLCFSALQIKEWNQGCFGMSPEIASAVSISICSLAEAGGMIIMPFIARKVQNRKILVVSTVLLIVSNALCFFTSSAAVIIIMRFFAGLGFAGNKQVSNSIIANGYETYEERQTNLVQSNAGIIGGILCGMGFGAIIAGVFGYSATFLGAAVGCIGFLIFNLTMVPWKLISQKQSEKEVKGSPIDRKSLKIILTSSLVWKQTLLIVVPQYIFLMVIVSLIPGRIQSAGVDNVVLTYCNLLNGVFGLYLGVYIQKFLQKRMNQVRILILMFLLGILSMIILDGPYLILMLLISSILSGINDGVGTPLATDIFIGNRVFMMNLDEDTSLMIYSVIGYAAMTIAPLILEMCEKSRIWMVSTCGVFLIICALIGLLFTNKNKAKPKHN